MLFQSYYYNTGEDQSLCVSKQHVHVLFMGLYVFPEFESMRGRVSSRAVFLHSFRRGGKERFINGLIRQVSIHAE